MKPTLSRRNFLVIVLSVNEEQLLQTVRHRKVIVQFSRIIKCRQDVKMLRH